MCIRLHNYIFRCNHLNFRTARSRLLQIKLHSKLEFNLDTLFREGMDRISLKELSQIIIFRLPLAMDYQLLSRTPYAWKSRGWFFWRFLCELPCPHRVRSAYGARTSLAHVRRVWNTHDGTRYTKCKNRQRNHPQLFLSLRSTNWCVRVCMCARAHTPRVIWFQV